MTLFFQTEEIGPQGSGASIPPQTLLEVPWPGLALPILGLLALWTRLQASWCSPGLLAHREGGGSWTLCGRWVKQRLGTSQPQGEGILWPEAMPRGSASAKHGVGKAGEGDAVLLLVPANSGQGERLAEGLLCGPGVHQGRPDSRAFVPEQLAWSQLPGLPGMNYPSEKA